MSFQFLQVLLALLILGSQAFGEAFVSTKRQSTVFFLNPFVEPSYLNNIDVVGDWSWQRVVVGGQVDLVVPAETGRGAFAPVVYSSGNPVFLKGTGLNPEHAGENNRIRYITGKETDPESLGVSFDGIFRSLQGVFDIYNSAFLGALGVKVPRPLGIVTSSPGTGIYAREFIVQTRLSNLEVMTDAEALNALNQTIKKVGPKLDLVKYFFWFADVMARQAARMQAVGFEHGVLHSQQVTLAAEIGDLSTGRWLDDPEVSSWGKAPKQEYFRFQYQPLLIQNMVVRTHSVSSNPPVGFRGI